VTPRRCNLCARGAGDLVRVEARGGAAAPAGFTLSLALCGRCVLELVQRCVLPPDLAVHAAAEPVAP
jgi:hypothetical protein